MTLHEAIGETLHEMAAMGPDNPLFQELMNPAILGPIMTFAAKQSPENLPQAFMAAMAIGITVGRKYPEVKN